MNRDLLQQCADQLSSQAQVTATLEAVTLDDWCNTGQTLCLSLQERLAVRWEDELTHEQLHSLAAVAATNRIVVSTFFPTGIASRLRDLGVQYMDSAGNAFISVPGMHIAIIGKQKTRPSVKPPANIGKTKTGKAFQTAGLRVVFELLNKPELANASMRTLAEVSGVSLGSVNAIHKDLTAHRFLKKTANGIRLMDKEKLLQRWAELYPYALRQKLLVGHYTCDRDDWWQSVRPASGVQLGGEIAAYQLSPYLTPKDGLLYIERASLPELMKNLRLRKIRDGESVTRVIDVFEAFWNIADSESITAPELVVFSDLLATDDPRCMDAAERIKHEYLG